MSQKAFDALSKFKLDYGEDSLLVRGDGIDLELKDGQLFIRNGTVTLSGGGRLIDRPSPGDIKIGMRMDDGTVYAGISPDTGKPMYATPKDAPLTYTFREAVQYAADLAAHGHRDWRLPDKGELNALFQNYWMIGAFNTTGSVPGEWYWSSLPTAGHSDFAWAQRFSNGYQDNFRDKRTHASLRCVRG